MWLSKLTVFLTSRRPRTPSVEIEIVLRGVDRGGDVMETENHFCFGMLSEVQVLVAVQAAEQDSLAGMIGDVRRGAAERLVDRGRSRRES